MKKLPWPTAKLCFIHQSDRSPCDSEPTRTGAKRSGRATRRHTRNIGSRYSASVYTPIGRSASRSSSYTLCVEAAFSPGRDDRNVQQFSRRRRAEYVWSVDEGGEVYEAKVDRDGYHGCRLEDDDDMRGVVVKEWDRRAR